jgi:diaminopimelate dehydrogenase
LEHLPEELKNIRVVTDIKELGQVDVALLCTPTRAVPQYAQQMLALGINTVDSYDIHTGIWNLRQTLTPIAQKNNATAVIAAGWDPGTDSVVRALMLAMAPKGITYTNFGPGMSMGHTVAVKAINGVKNALSMTIPLGTGVHRRMVYVEKEEGADEVQIEQDIKSDPYFVNDETHVLFVPDVDALIDRGHGVNMTRKGVSGMTQNQLLSFEMRINNPALTAQIMLAAARATTKLTPGAYTMIEIPLIDLLPGNKEDIIKQLV